jgi:hypothetical protein
MSSVAEPAMAISRWYPANSEHAPILSAYDPSKRGKIGQNGAKSVNNEFDDYIDY